MKHIYLLLLSLMFIGPAFSQDKHTDEVFSYAESMPAAGYNIKEYFAKNIHYPPASKNAGVEGRVVIRFIVNEDGTISAPEVVHGVDKACDEEAKRLVKSMPKWKPGKMNGHPVKVYHTTDVPFLLRK